MNWMTFAPELYYLSMAAVFLVLTTTARPNAQRDYMAALVLSAVGVGVAVAGVRLSGDLFFETYRVDLYSQVFKCMLSMGLFLVIFLCSELKGVEESLHSEFYLLLTVCTLAMMLLVSAVHLLTIYLALELSSYSLYVLVFLRKERKLGLEASLKYFFIGATASAAMLFGMALLYGATGDSYLIELIKALPAVIGQPTVVLGLTLTLSGFFFKLAVFPFHFWAPDVYQASANQLAAYIATASKVAAIAILMRLVAASFGHSTALAHVLVALSIVSMTVGNLSAIVQKDLKRLLAYSSIAHAGYALIGILSMSRAGYTGAIFYTLALLLMKFTCFLVVVKVADDGRNLTLAHLAGLHRREPILALALMFALFGLAGIPPTIGFTGKLLVFTAAIESGYFTLVLIAMFNVVISLYYYLLVLKAAYLTEPEQDLPVLAVSPMTKILAGSLTGVMIVAGFYPAFLIRIAGAAANILM
jgi:NADH-quinone oxidoreductase subunit N